MVLPLGLQVEGQAIGSAPPWRPDHRGRKNLQHHDGSEADDFSLHPIFNSARSFPSRPILSHDRVDAARSFFIECTPEMQRNN